MKDKYNLLAIDDDEAMHIILNKLLGDEYNILKASSAQQGIDILAKQPVHFILTDIHMPGMTGLDFLEALTMDAERKNIPVLIITSQPSVEKEQKALGLGATDFIDKTLFNENVDELLNRIRTKLVVNVEIPDLPDELVLDKKEITKELLFDLSSGDFVTTTQKLCKILGKKLKSDHFSFWTIKGGNVQMLLANGIQPPRRYGPKNLKEEDTFKRVLDQKRPYMVNNVTSSKKGILRELSRDEKLAAEIGIPLFALTDKELVKNKMKIPSETPLFAFMMIKRKRVFTSKEFKMTSLFVMNFGTVLWRLYKNI
jgi:CheY-like chemotaxis protein